PPPANPAVPACLHLPAHALLLLVQTHLHHSGRRLAFLQRSPGLCPVSPVYVQPLRAPPNRRSSALLSSSQLISPFESAQVKVKDDAARSARGRTEPVRSPMNLFRCLHPG